MKKKFDALLMGNGTNFISITPTNYHINQYERLINFLFIPGGPVGLFIIFPEPLFGPPRKTSNCDIKGRPFLRITDIS